MKHNLYILLFAILLVGCKTSKVASLEKSVVKEYVYSESDSTSTSLETIVNASTSTCVSNDSTSSENVMSVEEEWDITTTTWTDSAGVTYTSVREKGKRRSNSSGKSTYVNKMESYNDSLNALYREASTSAKSADISSLEKKGVKKSEVKVSWNYLILIPIILLLAVVVLRAIKRRFM